MTEYVRVHLGEIAGSAADGIPVVASQKHGHDLVPDADKHVAVHQPCQRHRDRDKSKQRGINPAEPFEEVLPQFQAFT